MANAAMVRTSAVSVNASLAIVSSGFLIHLLNSHGWTEIRRMVLVVARTNMYAIPYLAIAVEAMVSAEWTRGSAAQDGKFLCILQL